MRNLLAVLLLLVCVSGCDMFQINRYDPVTVAQIDMTIAYELQNFDFLKDMLGSDAVDEIEIRHESELARLRAWKLMEEAKNLDE